MSKAYRICLSDQTGCRPDAGKFVPEDIDPTLCTHVVYGFATLDQSQLVIKPFDQWVDIDNGFYKKVTDLRRHGVKVSIAIGGWKDSKGDKYSRLVNKYGHKRHFFLVPFYSVNFALVFKGREKT